MLHVIIVPRTWKSLYRLALIRHHYLMTASLNTVRNLLKQTARNKKPHIFRDLNFFPLLLAFSLLYRKVFPSMCTERAAPHFINLLILSPHTCYDVYFLRHMPWHHHFLMHVTYMSTHKSSLHLCMCAYYTSQRKVFPILSFLVYIFNVTEEGFAKFSILLFLFVDIHTMYFSMLQYF